MDGKKGVIFKFLSAKSFILYSLVIFVFLGFVFGRAYYKNYQLKNEIRQNEEEYQKLLGENGDLRALLERVKSSDYPEKIGRSNFNLAKADEKVVVLVGELPKDSGQAKKPVLESNKYSNPLAWWNYFFKHN